MDIFTYGMSVTSGCNIEWMVWLRYEFMAMINNNPLSGGGGKVLQVHGPTAEG